jgi:dipeptidyl aminopeptidase/acylaminoacyl peptidase
MYELTMIDGVTEVLWGMPERRLSAQPLVVCVHGHHDPPIGARMHLNFVNKVRRLDRWGVSIASVSMPGYGRTAGPADYCGPRTVAAVASALEFLSGRVGVDPERVILLGYSRGAIVAGLVASRVRLAGLVLGAGFYDFARYYAEAPTHIQRAIERETGATPEAFALRDVLECADQITSPTLILHGQLDRRGGVPGARALERRLRENGVRCELLVYPDVEHLVPFREFFRRTAEFVSNIGARTFRDPLRTP